MAVMTRKASAVDFIILAAGRGERMRSATPKPLALLAGKPLLHYVLDSAKALRARRVVVVVPPDGDSVREAAAAHSANIIFAEQAKPRGTADAAECALQKLGGESGTALIVCADSPLVTINTLRKLAAAANKKSLALLTAQMPDATGYGRIVRDNKLVRAIVEERDADSQTKNIGEIFAGVLAAPLPWLKQKVRNIGAKNKARERYLTDLAKAAAMECYKITTVRGEESEALGVNSPRDLAKAESALRQRRAEILMKRGARVIDPLRLDIRGIVTGGADAVIDINVVLIGRVTLGRGCVIGANCVVADCDIGAGARIEPFCHLHGAKIGRECSIGPFARVRPQTIVESGARIGNFVEVKNSTLKKGAKANHLAYIGDSDIGANANIAAGVITCNYDGKNKHRTIVGDGAFVGSGAQLVAPVKVGKGAYIAAGSTITRDAPANALTVARCRQQTRRIPRGKTKNKK